MRIKYRDLKVLEQLQPFVMSLLIGLIIGIERERSHPIGMQAFGVRTFILLALLGTIAASIDEPLLRAVISVFVLALIIVGYLRSTQNTNSKDIGATTEFSAGVVYCLGYIAFNQTYLAATLGAAVLVVLLGRERLHAFSRQQLKPEEIRAASTIMVLGLGILPFLPDRFVDPWQLFNPRLFGMLVLSILIIQFASYVAIRVFGQRFGMIFTGFFGGMLSSTAMFVTLPKLAKEQPELNHPIIVAGLFAVIGTLVKLIAILSIISVPIMTHLFLPTLTMVLIGIIISFFLLRSKIEAEPPTQVLNPLDIKGVIQLSILLASIILAVGIIEHFLGTGAVKIGSFLGGLFELHSVSYANATLAISGQLPFAAAEMGIFLAIIGSYVSKFALLWSINRGRFSMLTSLFLLLMLVSGCAVYFINLT
jgi:uncharacterized membrane protein (DUF4010 family)